LRGRIEA